MKRILQSICLFAVVVVFAVSVAACGKKGETGTTTLLKVNVTLNNVSGLYATTMWLADANTKLPEGNYKNIVKWNTNNGRVYFIEGWYTDSGLTRAFDFATALTADVSLYPKVYECFEFNHTAQNFNVNNITTHLRDDVRNNQNFAGSVKTLIMPSSFGGDYSTNTGSVSGTSGLKVLQPTASGAVISNCAGIETLVIPETVGALRGSIADNCVSLKNVYLPSYLRYSNQGGEGLIGDDLFTDCNALEKIYVPDEDTKTYVLHGGAGDRLPVKYHSMVEVKKYE